MGRYIDWKDVTNRYRLVGKSLDATQVGSSFVPYAESEVDGRLAAKFTVPFSNNVTAVKDLCIDLVYVKAGNINVKESKRIMDAIDSKIMRLLDGKEMLIDDVGNVIHQSVAGTIYSTTKNYAPTFGVGEVTDMEADPDRVDDEADARE